MSEIPIPDEAARRHALDPSHSFIVQAPAGAGKTELLTQRYLVLLAVVERPEEILAITFTKKAAAEMRARVLDALACAADDTPPDSIHKRRTWELARRARERDQARGWRIEQSPGRLRIQTIDSFCLGLTQQMPLLARFGAPPGIVEDAGTLYREAAQATLAMLDDDSDERHASVAQLLRHLDNDWRRTTELLADMLARRDQWLRYVVDPQHPSIQRERLEAALDHVLRDALAELPALLPPPLAAELLWCARVAAANLHAASVDSPIVACLDIDRVPGVDPAQRPRWLGIAELLLTAAGTARAARGITKKQGFPAESDGATPPEKAANKQAKLRMAELLGKLGEHAAFIERLHALRTLPPLQYAGPQWQVLQALVEVLPLAAAQLKLVFAAHAKVDFSEVSQGALAALGDAESPTDLLLALDYRLQHVLVDEFQDTSVSQSVLLERLTAGWTPGDGRTLFLVGDPMQSIYRFREAEVGLYLRATHAGIGGVVLEKLTLSANFRSQAGVVEWVNDSFGRIFPRYEDVAAGGVCYSPCVGVRPKLPEPAVVVHPFFDDIAGEAEHVVALVEEARARDGVARTAILVRNRKHLTEIVLQLKRAGLPFRAIEIDSLAQRQIVQDLFALTRALAHSGDRSAWLAVLRAPYCGLTLADLHALAADKPTSTIVELMADEARLGTLSADGQARLRRVHEAVTTALAHRGRTGWRRHVEGLWFALGGPACAMDDTELADAEVFFELLDEAQQGGMVLSDVAARIEKLFAATDVAADDRLQIMTIHKAKGLEFDVVIVPGLGRRPRVETTRLLQWTERTRSSGETDLLLAPVQATGGESDAISSYLRELDKLRARNEELRLLYVAATRAKRQLHWLGHVPLKRDDSGITLGAPAAGSLLASLWPVVEPVFQDAYAKGAVAAASSRDVADWSAVQDIRRLVAGWTLPPAPAAVAVTVPAPIVSADDEIEFKWVGETARHVGTVVHRWLMRIGADGPASWNETRMGQSETAIQLSLARLGVATEEIPAAVKKVIAAVTTAFGDPRARWLLDAHPEARSEYALTGVLDGRVVNVVLDRTFVDNDGVRWIVDYKTSEHEGADVEAFLDSEQARYTAQLERYARLLSKTEARPIKLGLYFPMLRGWREFEFRQR